METDLMKMENLARSFYEVNHEDTEKVKNLAREMAEILLDLPYENPFNRTNFCDKIFNTIKYSKNNINDSHKKVIDTVIKTGLEVCYKVNKDSDGTVIADPWTLKALESGYEYIKSLPNEKEIKEILNEFKQVTLEDTEKIKELSTKMATYVNQLPVEKNDNNQLYVWNQVYQTIKEKENRSLIAEVIAKQAVNEIYKGTGSVGHSESRDYLINGISGMEAVRQERYVSGNISRIRDNIHNKTLKEKPQI